MKETTDLAKFLRREFRSRAKPKVETLEDEIERVLSFNKELTIGTIIVDDLNNKLEIASELHMNTIIEDNILYFSEHKKMKYKIGHI